MNAFSPTIEPLSLPSDLFVRCPLALPPVEARLVILALRCLPRDSQRLAFALTFADILRNGNADDSYARLEKAQKRLTQPIQYETLRQGARCRQYIPLFTELSLDQATEGVTGVFNPHLHEYLLALHRQSTTAQLEAFLMRR